MDTSNPSGPANSRAVPPPLPKFANEPTIELSAADLEPSEKPPTSAAEPAAATEADAATHESTGPAHSALPAKELSPPPPAFWTTRRVLLLAGVASVLSGAVVYLLAAGDTDGEPPAAPNETQLEQASTLPR